MGHQLSVGCGREHVLGIGGHHLFAFHPVHKAMAFGRGGLQGDLLAMVVSTATCDRALIRIGKLWLDTFTMLVVAIPISVLILHYAWPYMAVSYVRGEGSPNAGGMPWLFLPKAMILAGFALVLTEALRQALAGGRRLVFHYRRPRRNHEPARET